MSQTQNSNWENAPFLGQSAKFQHSLVYILGDCLRALKTHRNSTKPKTAHLNVQMVLLACAFFEAALNRGLVNAAQHRLSQLPNNPANRSKRQKLTKQLDKLFDGVVYGDPILSKVGESRYSLPINAILDVALGSTISPEIAQSVRCLFLLRNMVVHGQTLTATGIIPRKFNDPIGDHRPRPTDKVSELESHLEGLKLLSPMTLAEGSEFPFLNDAVLDHFLQAVVAFFRTLQGAIADEKLRHEFGSGIPQNIFRILTGEAVEL